MIMELLATNGYIRVNKRLIRECGLYEAIMLGELCGEYLYWKDRDALENGWFFSTIENVEYNTTLSAYQQREAIKNLVKMGLIECEKRGLPAKRWFKINEEKLENRFI